MTKERIEYLLKFMNVLNDAQQSGHNMYREIDTVTKELMYELNLNKPQYSKEQRKYDEYISIIKEIVGEEKYKFNYLINIIYRAVKDINDSYSLKEIQLPYLRGSGATTNSIAICKLYGSEYCHIVVTNKFQKQRLCEQYQDIDILISNELKGKKFLDFYRHIFILEDGVEIEGIKNDIPEDSAIIKLIGV